MSCPDCDSRSFSIGAFEVNPEERSISGPERLVRVDHKAMHVLCFLAQNAERTVSRAEIFAHVWPDTAVSDEVLTVAISTLRRAMNDDARTPRIIRTLPKRGYKCVVAPMALLDGEGQKRSRVAAGPMRGRVAVYRNIGAVVVVLAAVAVALLLALEDDKRGGQVRSIAVLPLDYYSKDNSRRYLAAGLTEELTSALAKIDGMVVASRGNTALHAGSSRTFSEIAHDLGVDALLEGSIQVEADRFRIHVQLIDGANEQHLWAEDYDRPLTALLDTQSELAAEVARRISGGVTTSGPAHLPDPESYDLYLKARYLRHEETGESLAEASRILEQVVARSPKFAVAHAALAETLILRIERAQIAPGAGFQRGKIAANEALRLDPDLAGAHAARAVVALSLDWDFELAGRSFGRALDLDPNDIVTLKWYARYLSVMSRHEEAVAVSGRIRELDPHSYVNLAHIRSLSLAGRYGDAIARLAEIASIIPEHPGVQIAYAELYNEMGVHDKAVGSLLKYFAIRGMPETFLEELNKANEREGPMAVYRALVSESSPIPSSAFRARLHAILGNYDAAMAHLERSVETRDMSVLWMNADRSFAPLWSTPRFRRLAADIGLPQPPVGS